MTYKLIEYPRFQITGNEITFFRFAQAHMCMTPVVKVKKNAAGRLFSALETYNPLRSFAFTQSADDLLTPKEKKVIMTILESPKGIKEIHERARTIGIARNTFNGHLTRIKDKLADKSTGMMRPGTLIEIIFSLWWKGYLQIVPAEFGDGPQTP